MKEPNGSPEPDPQVSGKQALKNMKDLTKRIVSVPKKEIEEAQRDDGTPEPKPA